MSDTSELALSTRHPARRIIAWILMILSCSLIVGALVATFVGLTTSQSPTSTFPAPGSTLHLIRDVALPSIVIPPQGHAPIQALPFDGFDFQALDPQTGRLFISHPGPSFAVNWWSLISLARQLSGALPSQMYTASPSPPISGVSTRLMSRMTGSM